MTSQQASDRIITVLSLIACLVFTLGLRDAPLRPLGPPPLGAGPDAGVHDVVVEASVFARCGKEPCAAVVGATVRAFWYDAGRYYLTGRARSGESGRAVLRGLPRGTYWLLAEGVGLERVSLRSALGPGTNPVEFRLGAASRLRVRVLDGAGEPIERATVLVQGADPLPFGKLTGRDGRAPFDRLGAGPISVKVSAPGFESVTRDDVRSDLVVTLRDLGELHVRVRGPDGKPAVGATVLVVGARLWPARSVSADARGEALINGLLFGAYDLKASRGEQVSQTSVGVMVERGQPADVELLLEPGRSVTVAVFDAAHPRSDPIPSADVVLVESGLSSFPLRGRTGLDGTVRLGPIAAGFATVSARAAGFVPRGAVSVPDVVEGPVRVPLLHGGRIEGKVIDRRGYPVDGASIEVVGTDLEGMPVAETPELVSFRSTHFSWSLGGPAPLIPAGELGVMPGPIPPIPNGPEGVDLAAIGVPFTMAADVDEPSFERWVTRANGEFVASPVTPGRLRVLVRHPAYVEGASKTVLVDPGATAKVEVVLSSGGSLEGRVLDERRRPLGGARVEVVAVEGDYERSTLTGWDGAFEFASVPGEVFVSVALPSDLGTIVVRQRASVPEGERTRLELELPPPRERAEVLVVDEERRPVLGAQVSVLSLVPEIPLRKTLFSDADGKVTFPDVRGLRAEIAVEAPTLLRVVQAFDSVPERTALVLTRGVTVTGRITAVRGRSWVSGASVTFVAGGARFAGLSNAEGDYRVSGVPPGAARVLVSHPDFAPLERDVTVVRPSRPDRAYEVGDLELDESGSIEGEVVDAAGKPVMGARVALEFVPAYLPAGSLPHGMTVTDMQGRFRLAGVAPGRVTVAAFAPEIGRGERANVEVTSGRTASAGRIALAPEADGDETIGTATLAVTLGERGDPPETLLVHVAEGSEAERAGLAAGDVIVSIDGAPASGMRDARRRLAGAEGSDTVVSVRRAGRALSVRVRREKVRH